MTSEERFWRKVDTRGECWVWLGARKPGGYGNLMAGGVYYSAHRYSWTIAVGPVPDGMQVLHRCDNRACVRPDHLFLGSQLDNIHDMWRKGRGNPERPDETRARGARHGMARLKPEDVLRIRDLAASASVSQRTIASEFGISQQTVSKIHRRENWARLAEPIFVEG